MHMLGWKRGTKVGQDGIRKLARQSRELMKGDKISNRWGFIL